MIIVKEIRTSQIRINEIRLKMTIRIFRVVTNARSTIRELVFWERMYVSNVENEETSPCFVLRTNNLGMNNRNIKKCPK